MSRIKIPSNYQNYYAHTEFQAMDSLTGWVEQNIGSGGTATIATGAGPFGEDVFNIVMLGASSQHRRTKTISQQFNGGFGVWLNFPDPSKVHKFAYFVSANGFTNYFIHTIDVSATDVIQAGWNFIYRPQSQFASQGAGTASWDDVMTDFRVVIITDAAENTTGDGYAQIGPIWAPLRTRPTCCIMFDDANDTDATIAEPYLTARGLKATSYIIPDKIGEANFLSEAQLTTLYAAGWDLAVHGDDTFKGQPYNHQLERLQTNRKFLADRGFTRAINHMSYPLGEHDINTGLALDAAGFKTARTIIGYGFAPTPYYDLRLINARGGQAGTGAEALTEIDKAILDGCSTGVYTHRLQPTTGGNHWAEAEWKIFIDGLVIRRDKGLIDVPTISEWYNGYLGRSVIP